MEIREIIENVERAKENIMKEISRIDNVLQFLYQKESELHSEKDLVFKGKVEYIDTNNVGRYEVNSGTAYLSEYLDEFDGEDVVIYVISV